MTMIAGYLIYTNNVLVGTCKSAEVAAGLKSKGHVVVTVYY